MYRRTKNITKNKAQSVAEYAIFLGVIALVFIGMNAYVKRGIAGRLKDAADFPLHAKEKLGYPTNNFSVNATQYEPLYAFHTTQTNHDSTSNARMYRGGSMQTITNSNGTVASTEIISDTY